MIAGYFECIAAISHELMIKKIISKRAKDKHSF